MSLWSLLTATAVLPTDLVTAGIVTAAASVIPGRKPQAVTDQRGEVWLEHRGTQQVGSGLQHVWACTIRVHVRTGRGNLGGNKAGTAQLTSVEAKLETIARRYAAGVPFVATSGLEGMQAVTVSEPVPDEDPEEAGVASGYVDLTFRVKE